MKKSWKTGNRTYDTDRYEMIYHFCEETFHRGVWAGASSVGPCAYNRSNIGLIMGCPDNSPGWVMSSDNPFFAQRTSLSKDSAKFKP